MPRLPAGAGGTGVPPVGLQKTEMRDQSALRSTRSTFEQAGKPI
jgi:hypothetical protein